MALDRVIVTHVRKSGFPEVRRSHGRVMSQLVHEDGQRARVLARNAGLTAQSMGELIDDLESHGLVVRKDDPDDRRAKRVFLTARGRRAADASGVAVRQIERTLAEMLGADYARVRAAALKVIERYGVETE